MDRFKKILIPIDGKRTSYNCLELACHIAVKNDSSLHLLHIINLSVISKVAFLSDGNPDEMIEKAEKIGKMYFRNFKGQIQEESGKKFNFTEKIIKANNVDEAIIEYAQDHDIDLIVIGLTSKKHAEDVIVGHVTLRVVEFSRIPVLTLPTEMDKIGNY
ncbi:MAG: universal stress protein [Promethearchaeota archaeon]